MIIQNQSDMNQAWEPHGDSRVYWEKNILIMELSDGFNIEGALVCINKAKALIETREVLYWAFLIKLGNDDTLLPPDALHDVEQFFAWCQREGCSAVAYTIHNTVQQYIINQLFKDSELPCEQLKQEAAAREWLNERLIPI
ncbi:hypothetical protein [Neptuniibacter caesariensis]|uniref:STAS/SEC14 domain-containing protein n=1 Tax=Neptuniibacter caesariensis TaxID=207954 RepID=A0A7U8C5Z2_NEPCE|nr:hypothetical protein [Neptuniibacter caesariensis]EAR61321.1 hypothetical protein MED92_11359 [Oceanospirillum sp. MED92] [Neptuniibacter caesariensis]